MISPPRSRTACATNFQAFTLLEILVAMTVLAVIVVLMAQVFAGVSSNASMSSMRLQENSDVRNAMDRVAFDLEAMVRGGNTVPVFNSNANGGGDGNDAIAFLSNVRAMSGTTYSRLAEIGYFIAPASSDTTLLPAEAALLGTQPVLMRANTPVEWTTDLSPFSANQASTGTVTSTVKNYQVLNPDIFRIEVYFQLVDGTLVSIPKSVPTANGTATVPDWSIVQSIHIAFAVLDQKTRTKMSAAQLQFLCGDPVARIPSFLKDYVASSYTAASSTTPVTIWMSQITTTPLPSQITPPVVAALHFYERSYDLH